jgi:hypothetical protein
MEAFRGWPMLMEFGGKEERRPILFLDIFVFMSSILTIVE